MYVPIPLDQAVILLLTWFAAVGQGKASSCAPSGSHARGGSSDGRCARRTLWCKFLAGVSFEYRFGTDNNFLSGRKNHSAQVFD